MARGRPVSFDKSETLEKALHVFWQAGFLNASYTELCAATGLTKPSLYGAYGNKEEMFLTALNMYLDRFIRPSADEVLQTVDARAGIEALLIGIVEGLIAEGTPKGCMIANNIACVGAADMPVTVADALRQAIKETPNAILTRLSDSATQDLPDGMTPEALALYFEAVISGLSGLARQGTKREELLSIVDMSMRVWRDE